MFKWLVTTIIICSISVVSHANVFHDSNLNWKTIETEHYYLHFHDGEESIVRKFLPVANHIHNQVTDFLQWVPKDKTHVVFTDEFDLSNGFATVFPRTNTHIFLSSPDDINSLEDNDGWLELVFRHEYLHIVHLDKARGAPLTVRKILGRHPFYIPTTFPNAYQPNWYIEGLATYYETDNERGIGRGQSSYYNMLMRMELLGGLKKVRQINQPIGTWPAGAIPYLYGVNHYQFIQEKYGETKIQALVEGLSDNVIPYRIDSNTQNVFNKNLDLLWFEFKKYLHEKHDPLIAKIKSEGVREGKALSRHGYEAKSLQAINDKAFYISFNGRSHHVLMRSQAGKPAKVLREINFGARLSIHKDKGILITQPERCRNARVYYDIYKTNFDGGEYTRLTHCARYRFATWTNNADTIVAVHNELGINSLHLLDGNAKFIKKLWQGDRGEQISHLTFSPTENNIIASVWRKDLGWNLEKFDLSENTWTAVTRDNFIQSQPHYLDDGKSIVYTSDDNGIYNIYKMNLKSKKRTKLTNVIGGAFSPALTSKGLFYLGYRSQGYDLFYMPSVKETKVTRINKSRITKKIKSSSRYLRLKKEKRKTSELKQDENLVAQDYSPWSSMTPTWWLPSFIIDDQRTELGFQTFNNDALYRHTYALSLRYDFSKNWLNGSVNYLYDGFWPIFHLGMSRNSNIFLNSNNKTQRIRADDQAIMEVITPFTTLDSVFTINAAALTTRESDRWLKTGVSPASSSREDVAALGFRYSSAARYPLSVSRSGGRAVSMVYEDSDAIGNSDRKGQVTVAEWREFIHLGREHVLAFRVVNGLGKNNPKPFRLGGIQDFYTDYSLLITSPRPLFNKRNYSLRGYNEGQNQLVGKNMRLLSLEYRFPIARIEHGWMVPPFGFNQIHGTVFYDTGGVWDDNRSSPSKYYGSLGAEVNTDLDLFYSLRLHLTLGFAKGLDPDIGENKIYLRIGHQF